MNDVDVSKIKVGDVVGLEVIDVSDDGTVRLKSAGWVWATSIASHTPAPRPALKVGDRVRDPARAFTGRVVIWIGDEMVWLSPGPGDTLVGGLALSEVETWERV